MGQLEERQLVKKSDIRLKRLFAHIWLISGTVNQTKRIGDPSHRHGIAQHPTPHSASSICHSLLTFRDGEPPPFTSQPTHAKAVQPDTFQSFPHKNCTHPLFQIQHTRSKVSRHVSSHDRPHLHLHLQQKTTPQKNNPAQSRSIEGCPGHTSIQLTTLTGCNAKLHG